MDRQTHTKDRTVRHPLSCPSIQKSEANGIWFLKPQPLKGMVLAQNFYPRVSWQKKQSQTRQTASNGEPRKHLPSDYTRQLIPWNQPQLSNGSKQWVKINTEIGWVCLEISQSKQGQSLPNTLVTCSLFMVPQS